MIQQLIEELISDINRIFLGDLTSDVRGIGSVDGRKAFTFIMVKILKVKRKEVYFKLNKKHSVIRYYLKSHNNLMQTDSKYRDKFKQIDLEYFKMKFFDKKDKKDKDLILSKIINLENRKNELIKEYVT